MRFLAVLRRRYIVILILCAVCFALRNLTLSARKAGDGYLPHHFVCIIGNAPGVEEAKRVHEMWRKRFPTFFYLWKDASPASFGLSQIEELLFVQREPRGLPFTHGIEAVLASSRLVMKCEYYFTHDDDLVFMLNATRARHNSLVDELTGVLEAYRPAIASFHYAKAEQFPNLAQIVDDLYSKDDSVRAHPLIGFDNGMVIYHKSILDFFIPYSPRGEGNHTSGFTLNYFFIALFSTTVFREHALAFANIRYNNTFTINSDQFSVRPDGLVQHQGPRHLYEWKKNKRYVEFLNEGLKCSHCRWGRDILLSDIDWAVKRSPLLPDYGAADFMLPLMNKYFHLDHESLSKNELLHTRYQPDTLVDAISRTPVRIRIFIFTYRRQRSFQRLWRSIVRANRISSTVEVTILHDFEDIQSDEALKMLNALAGKRSCPHGPVRVEAFSANRRLKHVIMDAWWPTDFDEYAIFLEDDLDVSASFLEYAEAMIHRYFYCSPARLRWRSNLLGISLYASPWNEVTEKLWVPPQSSSTYLWQMPTSWGFVLAPSPWSRFQVWWRAHDLVLDPLVADSYANRWPASSSWKKYLLRWMVSTGHVLVYPSLLKGQSLSANLIELGGTNDLFKSESPQLVALRQKFYVPLVNESAVLGDLLARTCPSDASQLIVDAWGARHNHFHALASPKRAESFDSCTIVMAVCHRVESILSRLKHYGALPQKLISAFVVVWQPCLPNNSIPVMTKLASGANVTFLAMARNSMNNRFYPHPFITTDCVVSIDDDLDVPLDQLKYAISVWRGHFFNNLVGFSSLSRNHWPSGDGAFRYSSEGWRSFASMVLPAAMVYHRKYLDYYTYSLSPVLRDIVDNLTNCDDILFNFMVANLTNEGPAVVNASIRPLGNVDVKGGLWHRQDHMMQRTWCINKFTELFGKMPLRYTTTFFSMNRIYGTFAGVPPGKHHFAHQPDPPKGARPP